MTPNSPLHRARVVITRLGARIIRSAPPRVASHQPSRSLETCLALSAIRIKGCPAMGPALTELRGGRNRDMSRRRGRKDKAGRARRIRPDAGWHDLLLEPRIAPAVLDLTG